MFMPYHHTTPKWHFASAIGVLVFAVTLIGFGLFAIGSAVVDGSADIAAMGAVFTAMGAGFAWYASRGWRAARRLADSPNGPNSHYGIRIDGGQVASRSYHPDGDREVEFHLADVVDAEVGPFPSMPGHMKLWMRSGGNMWLPTYLLAADDKGRLHQLLGAR